MSHESLYRAALKAICDRRDSVAELILNGGCRRDDITQTGAEYIAMTGRLAALGDAESMLRQAWADLFDDTKQGQTDGSADDTDAASGFGADESY